MYAGGLRTSTAIAHPRSTSTIRVDASRCGDYSNCLVHLEIVDSSMRRTRPPRRGLRPEAALVVLLLLSSRSSAAGWDEAIDASISRATAWMESVHVDPFGGGVPAFRSSVIEIEVWHRLWCLEQEPSRKSQFREEAVSRLEEILDRSRLEAVLRLPEGSSAFTEAAVLAARCRIHGLDPTPIREALAHQSEDLAREIGQASPSIRALYAVYLPRAGIAPPVRLEEVRPQGILARRPQEVEMTLSQVYYLTHEVYALTDYAMEPLRGLSDEEQSYLLRVLAFYTIFYGALDNLDITAELITCLNSAGMRDIHAYHEGIRIVLESQNPDGSFGAPDPRVVGRQVAWTDYLHPTMNCITALGLERRARRAAGR